MHSMGVICIHKIKQTNKGENEMENNNVVFTVIKKNGKPFMRMEAYGQVTDMMIYKVKTDKPYIRYFGRFFYLDKDMKKELAFIA